MTSSFIAILIFFAIHAFAFLGGGLWLLLHNKEQHDHSRIFMGLFLVGMAISCCIFIATAFLAPAEKQFEASMLEPYPSIISFFIWALLPLYVYEMRNPGRLTILRLLLSYSPWLALIIGFVTWHAFTGFKTMIPLTSFGVIAEHIRQPEVLLRIALAVVYLPYGLIVLIQKNTWREASVPQPWVNIISVITFVFTCTFILGMLCRITILMYLHTLLCDALLAIVLYMEAHIRIPLPVSAPQSEKVVITRLAAKLQELMDTGIWKNPDITRDDYCRLLGTNRLYMAKAVQSLGYSNIADMLNHYRLELLHQLLQKYPNAKVQDLVFEAGYRNRETANRLFAQKYGNTLTAYRLGGGVKIAP